MHTDSIFCIKRTAVVYIERRTNTRPCRNSSTFHVCVLSQISCFHVHPKLHNINLHNVTHYLISWNPRECMFIVRISLLIVTFLSLISQNLSLVQTTKEANPHPCIAPWVNMWSVTFLFFFFFFCHLLNVGACIRHIAHEDQVEWTTLT